MSRQAWGRPVMQTLVMAVRRHDTILAPVVKISTCAARQAAVWAVPTVARVAAQRGTRGIRARPFVLPKAVQGAARSLAQTGVRGVGTQELVVVEEEVVDVLEVPLLAGLVVVVVEPPPGVVAQAFEGSPRPIELRRQVRIARGSEIVCFRQLSAAPTANGPRAAVQEMRSWGS